MSGRGVIVDDDRMVNGRKLHPSSPRSLDWEPDPSGWVDDGRCPHGESHDGVDCPACKEEEK